MRVLVMQRAEDESKRTDDMLDDENVSVAFGPFHLVTE